MKLIFATNNLHKLREVQALLHHNIALLSILEIGCHEELPETRNTLEENALQKAKYVHEKYKVDCFADDTGLEIEALNGKPGVYSARYAGEECSAEKNIKKVLEEMKNKNRHPPSALGGSPPSKGDNRSASFKTIIALIINNKEYLFEGVIDGIILSEPRGKLGFGYDPIFQPKGFEKSFAEMSIAEKNNISHRAIAIKKLSEFLNQLKS